MKPIKLTNDQMDAALGLKPPGMCIGCGAPPIHVGAGRYWRWEHKPTCDVERELTHVEKTLLGALK